MYFALYINLHNFLELIFSGRDVLHGFLVLSGYILWSWSWNSRPPFPKEKNKSAQRENHLVHTPNTVSPFLPSVLHLPFVRWKCPPSPFPRFSVGVSRQSSDSGNAGHTRDFCWIWWVHLCRRYSETAQDVPKKLLPHASALSALGPTNSYFTANLIDHFC